MRVHKTLGRCSKRHAQVVEFADGDMPAGVCRYVDKKRGDLLCGEPLIEWALKGAKESKG